MKNKLWIWNSISGVIAIYLVFNTSSIFIFLISAALLWVVIFRLGIAIVSLIKRFKKISKKQTFFKVLKILGYILISIIILLFAFLNGVATTNGTPRLETNMLTKECRVIQRSGGSGPWYVRTGCPYANTETKINLLDKFVTEKNRTLDAFCRARVEAGIPATSSSNLWDEVTCQDLLEYP
jgi:hypothetical protein